MTSIYQALAELEKTGRSGVLCTIVSAQGSTPRNEGSKMLVYPDGSFVGTIGGGELESRMIREALEVMETGKARKLAYTMADPQRGDPGVCGGQLEIFAEPVLPKPLLVVVGCGHVGREVAHLGSWLGFEVAAVDDRPEFCTPEYVPDADAFYPHPLEELAEHLEITPRTYFVLTTRNVDVDVTVLPALLDSPAAYVGVIGSRRRWATTRQKLLEAGVPNEKLDAVRSPVGLKLDAETPREIALSILAEILMVRGNADGKPLSA